MRRHAAAAVWDEVPPGEPWTATLYASPSSPPSAISTPTTTPCSCRVSTANRLEHKCTSASRTSSSRGATVLRCSMDNERQSTRLPEVRRSAAPDSQLFSHLIHIVDCPGGHCH